MPNNHLPNPPTTVRPPSKHAMAVMIWLAVFPTLLAINLALSDWLTALPIALRTLVLASIAVPIVIYGLMPVLQRLRRAMLAGRTARATN